MTSTEIANASKIMIGTTEAIKMYIGSTLLYVKQSSTQNKVWVSLTDQSITSSTPIYKIGVTNISQNLTVCRVGFTKEAGLTNVSDPAEYPSRLWYSGDSQNKVSIHWKHGNSIYNLPLNWYPQGSNKGWIPYSDIHIQLTITLKDNTTINNVWVYDCLNGTYTDEDDEGNNPLYFYYSLTNSPLSNFYVMIDDDDYSNYYFTIESLQDNNSISIQTSNTSPGNKNMSYSLDRGVTWTDLTLTNSKSIATINTGDKILFKGINSTMSNSWDRHWHFRGGRTFKVYGNVMSLLFGDDFKNNSEFTSGTSHNLCGIFYGTTTLVDASNLILPALTCTTSCYNGMFRGCTNLTTAPTLPATVSAMDCYSSMFEGCINLEEAPEINLTNLSLTCCLRMFCMDRNSKITTPKMTKSPILRVAVGASNCYKEMFKGNGNLVEVTCLLTSNMSSCDSWLTNCSSTGTFKKASTASWGTTGTSSIPSGWTVEDYVES